MLETIHEYVITWSTRLPTNQSIVIYNSTHHQGQKNGEQTRFEDGGPLKAVQYFHNVRLQNLKPNVRYIYVCGSDSGWSTSFYFTTTPTDREWSPRVAIFGDMGYENAQSLDRLEQHTKLGMYDAILHVGDLAYDLDTDNAHVGDEFMEQLQKVAAYVPYMVAPGNHEEK